MLGFICKQKKAIWFLDRFLEEFIGVTLPKALSGAYDPANGMYIEYHNTPHLYIAQNKESSGYLILAKKLSENKYMVAGLSVPYNKVIYLPPYTIHNEIKTTPSNLGG